MYIDEAKKARRRIENIIVKTPLLHSDIFSKLSSNDVFMKCENLQVTGAYKIRGALNKISQLSEEEKKKGVVCSSAGNHAQGVAYASSLLGIESTIVMPKTTPYLKVQSTRNYGGNTVLFGSCYDDAFLEAKRIEKEEGKVFIPPFDDFDIIYGQGTIALEILEDLPEVDYIVCPIGGGGLISGISLVAKSINPNVKINAFETFFLPDTADMFDFSKYDYVVDAIDTVKGKIEIILRAEKAGVKIISSMGAGNKLDPTLFEVSDIYKTSVCPLARVMRRELKARGIKKLKVVYSKEEAIKIPSPDGERPVPGSIAFVPSVAGLIIAGEIIKDLVKEE